MYLSPVGVTWLPAFGNEPPPDTPSAIATKLLEQAARPQQKHRSFRLTSETDDSHLLADAGRESIRRQLNEESDRGLLIRASLKLRRILGKTTAWTLVAMMPLTLVAFTLLGIHGRPAGGSLSPMFIGLLLTLWAIHVGAVAIAVLVQASNAPESRAFLPFRWFAIGPVIQGFVASRWLAGVAIFPATRHSWTAFGVILGLLMVGGLVSIYVRAFLLKPLDRATLDDTEREALTDWCAEGKITPPGSESMQPSSAFKSNGRWAWWRFTAAGVWLLALPLAPLVGLNVFEVLGTGVIVFPGLYLGLYLGYRAGFQILARINPYDRPHGFLSTVTGIVFFYAMTWTVLPLFPPEPKASPAFGPTAPP